MPTKWSKDQLEAMRERYPFEKTSSIANDIGVTTSAVYAMAYKLGLRKSEAYLESTDACRLRRGDNVGSDYRFKPGHTSWNKGTHFRAGGRSPDTRFKKGNKPFNEVPLGSLRVSKDGYLERKTSMTINPPVRRWEAVHRLVWIEANGPIPQDYIVRFKPGMKTAKPEEVTLDKLEMITRKQHMQRNSIHQYPKEIALVVQLRGALNRKINNMEKQNGKQ